MRGRFPDWLIDGLVDTLLTGGLVVLVTVLLVPLTVTTAEDTLERAIHDAAAQDETATDADRLRLVRWIAQARGRVER